MVVTVLAGAEWVARWVRRMAQAPRQTKAGVEVAVADFRTWVAVAMVPCRAEAEVRAARVTPLINLAEMAAMGR
jgi:hypothetical protein